MYLTAYTTLPRTYTLLHWAYDPQRATTHCFNTTRMQAGPPLMMPTTSTEPYSHTYPGTSCLQQRSVLSYDSANCHAQALRFRGDVSILRKYPRCNGLKTINGSSRTLRKTKSYPCKWHCAPGFSVKPVRLICCSPAPRYGYTGLAY